MWRPVPSVETLLSIRYTAGLYVGWQCKGSRGAKEITLHKCDGKMCIHIHMHLYTNCKKSYLLSRKTIGTHTQFAKWNRFFDALVYIMTDGVSDASFLFCHCGLYFSMFEKMGFDNKIWLCHRIQMHQCCLQKPLIYQQHYTANSFPF